MTITFNAWAGLTGMWRYDFTGDSFTNLGAGATSFDYFTNDCEAGDYLLFQASTINHTRNVKLNVGTSFAADAVTFIWEYEETIGNWIALSNVVDNTNNLSNIGVNTITFDMPDKWAAINKTGLSYGTWCRLRIVAVTNPTEGGANQTDTVKRGNNVIRITDEGTELAPITWDDVYLADVAGSWGVFTKEGAGHYRATRVAIYLNTSYLKQENDVFENYCCNDAEDTKFLEYFYNNSYYIMGKIDGNGEPYSGAKIVFYGGYRIYLTNTANGKLYCYDSTIYCLPALLPSYILAGNTINLNRVNIENIDALITTTNWSVKDVWHYKGFSFRPGSSPTSIVGWRAREVSNPMYFSLNTAPDIEMDDCDVEKILMYRRNVDSYMLNHKIVLDHADMTLTFLGISGTTYTGKLYDRYTFNLKVTDGENAVNNATVKITDNQSNTYNLTTDVNGKITQQKFTRKHYAYIPAAASGYNTTSYEYTIEIKKAGYTTYTKKFTMGGKTDWEIALQTSLLRNPAMTGGMS